MKELAIVLLGLTVLVLTHFLINRASRGAGEIVFRGIRQPLLRILTPRYRKKKIERLQEERRRQGLPPLENPDLL